MPATVSLRVYQLTVAKKSARSSLAYNSGEFKVDPRAVISKFVADHAISVEHKQAERSWALEEKSSCGRGSSKGIVQYGTFGFASNLKDIKTRSTQYRRKVSDLEEIPLYYEFWSPENDDFSLVAMQSFGGRSCVTLVLNELQNCFEKNNSGYIMRVKKLVPFDVSAGSLGGPPVKRLTLIRHDAKRDIAGRYFPYVPGARIDIEISMVARRRESLGVIGSLARALPRNTSGVVMHAGVSFDEVTADISVGNKIRRVGVFGSDSEAGTIDLSEDIDRGADGHPTFDSISEQCDEILDEFYQNISL